MALLFRQDFFHYVSHYKTSDPQGGATFWPQNHNLNKLIPQVMINTKYQCSMLYGFKQEYLFMFPYIEVGRFLMFSL